MTDRQDPGGGGLTGATGDLTPAESDDPFVPAERREQEGERVRGSVTYQQATAAPAQQGDVGDPGQPGDTGMDHPRGPTNLAERDAGYGSQHGLSPNDPAYRMEVDPPAAAAGPVPPREPQQGVDEVTDHGERF